MSGASVPSFPMGMASALMAAQLVSQTRLGKKRFGSMVTARFTANPDKLRQIQGSSWRDSERWQQIYQRNQKMRLSISPVDFTRPQFWLD